MKNLCKDFKDVNLITIEPCPSTGQRTSSILMSRLAEVECRRGLSDQKIEKCSSVRVDKLNFRESPVKISNVVGTPNSLSMSFIWAQCNLLSYYVECRHIMQRNSVPNLVYVFLKKKTVFNNFGSFLSTTTSFQLFVCFTKIPHLNI